MTTPDLNRIPEWYHNYIRQVTEADLLSALETQAHSFSLFLSSIPEEKYEYRYTADKWTIKEVIQHIIDGERVFAYRALCIARKEKKALPGFDENEYAIFSNANKRSWDDLIKEFTFVRQSTILLFKSFDDEQLEATGIASDWPVYVLGIGFIIAGHCTHHETIVKERYL